MINHREITGTQINYYFVCKRELWLFSNQLQCEQESDAVRLGKALHENAYKGEKKEFEFGHIKVDWLDLKNKVIHEVKKSNKAEKAHVWQLKYYIYYFRKNNIGDFTGELNYPKLKKIESVELSGDDEAYLKKIIDEITEITSLQAPPKLDSPMKFCKECSYYELCWI